MPLRPDMEPKEYLDVFLRRKWLVLFSIVLIMLGVAVYCVAVPDLYISTTTILVIPPSVSEKYVSSITQRDIQERIHGIQQEVLSRTRLLTVMDELGLYKEERKKRSEEALVEKMKGRLNIRVVRDKNAFVLSFEHENPKMAMLTASRLASFFVDENLRAREQQAINTSEFLDAQLGETRARLEEQEERIKRYKMSYLGELPQEMQANQNAMSRMQDQLRSNADTISRLEDRKMALESKISDLQKEISAVEAGTVGSEDPDRTLLAEIASRQKKIRELTLRYTPKYPTVIQLGAEVEELKRKLESNRVSRMAEAGNGGTGLPDKEARTVVATQERRELGRVQGQVAALNLEIKALKKESEEKRKTIDSIQDKVSRVPQREQEMVSLTRDYDNLKKAYNDLLGKKLGAKVSQNLEENEQGETFQLIDPPNLPSVPSKPDRLRILGVSLFVAIAVGFGGAFGREMLDQTLKSTKEFKCYFELPILATLPVIEVGRDQRKKDVLRTALLVGTCSLLSVIVIFLLVYRENIRSALQIAGGTG